MNDAMLKVLKSYRQDTRCDIISMLSLTTRYGEMIGFFYSEMDFISATDGSCCLYFHTKNALEIISIEDIYKFSIVKSMSFEDSRKWRRSKAPEIKNIGFKE